MYKSFLNMKSMRISVCVYFIFIIQNIHSYSIELQPGEKQCYSVTATAGMPCSGSFEVMSDDPSPIEVIVTGPSPHHKLLFESKFKGPGALEEDQSEGQFSFDADTEGDYTLCILNGNEAENDGEARLVGFNFRTISTGESDYQYTGLEAELDEMRTGLDFLIDHMSYMNQREEVHANSLLVMRGKILFWSIFEALLLICMGVWQVTYISKFFEVKRRL
mmetsp:Transcript_3971/g.4054  ORF Transcript_3971/g.4054 Transcript_3971/m.4054 type:complete len:219 (-) Transcript_3971:74-730(-)